MRWMTYVSGSAPAGRPGVLVGETIHGLDTSHSLVELLAEGTDGLREAGQHAIRQPVELVALPDVELLAPVPDPPSIRDFMAFEQHVLTSNRALGREMNPAWYENPVFYFSNPAAVRGPREPIPIAPGSECYDYELEVAAVIGHTGRNLSPREAEEHIAGYLILCDWSARDVQAAEMKVGLGPAKSKDTATSFGPFLITPDELEDRRSGNAFDLTMTAVVNGRPYSTGNMADLYWSFPQMLSHASRGTVLRPGDVVGSGTVGTGCILELSAVHGQERYPWLAPGDRVVLSIEEMGQIESGIVAAEPVMALS